MENKDYKENNEVKTEVQTKNNSTAVISYAEKMLKFTKDREK